MEPHQEDRKFEFVKLVFRHSYSKNNSCKYDADQSVTVHTYALSEPSINRQSIIVRLLLTE